MRDDNSQPGWPHTVGAIIGRLTGPATISRDKAVLLSERIGAVPSLLSSLEYLSKRESMQEGGLDDWKIAGGAFAHLSGPTRRVLDFISRPAVTKTLLGIRVASNVALIVGPSSGRWRGAANITSGAIGAILYPRYRFGTDGADQVSILTQSAMGFANITRNPSVKDAMLWYVSIESAMSYAVAGWTKLLGAEWRSGTALTGILRTHTYGHEGFWRWLTQHPRLGVALSHSVLVFECLFPLIYVGNGVVVRTFIAVAASFHFGNGFVMGLGRFVGSFISMHPAVVYTAMRGTSKGDRDDSVLKTLLATAVVSVGVVGASAISRRASVLSPPAGAQVHRTKAGNDLWYTGYLSDEPSTLLVFETGLLGLPEQFAWITDEIRLRSQCSFIVYSRAGTGASTLSADIPQWSIEMAAVDLLDLVDAISPHHTVEQVVLVGHSLGGEIVRRAALLRPGRIDGLVYLDSTHPQEIVRSPSQQAGIAVLSRGIEGLRRNTLLGLGALMSRPTWVRSLPEDQQQRAQNQFADSRLWTAGLREWKGTESALSAADPTALIDAVSSHALVLSAERTIAGDPIQGELHADLADAHRRGGASVVREGVIEDASHDSLLTSRPNAVKVATHIIEFVAALPSLKDDRIADGTMERTENA
jgi:pimeloyl-ACP methyl ester carboxylesterase